MMTAVLCLVLCSACFVIGLGLGLESGNAKARRIMAIAKRLQERLDSQPAPLPLERLHWKDRDMLPSLRAQVEQQEEVIQLLRDENIRAKALAREIIQPGTHHFEVRMPEEHVAAAERLRQQQTVESEFPQ